MLLLEINFILSYLQRFIHLNHTSASGTLDNHELFSPQQPRARGHGGRVNGRERDVNHPIRAAIFANGECSGVV